MAASETGTSVDGRALDGDHERDLLTRIAFRQEPEEGPGVEDCLWACRRERLERKRREVVREIGKLQQSPGETGVASQLDERLAELQRIAQRRDSL